MYPKAVSSQPHIASIRAAAMILAAAAAGGCATRTKRVTMDVVPTHNLPVAQKDQQIDLALSDQILIEAEPKAPLAVPKFPAGISLKTPVAVPMRIVVGTDGAVENVTLQPGKFSATVPYYSRFEAEIRKAVRDWTFVPARII